VEPLTTQDIIALYAPLAGVVGLAFWSGVLTANVKNLKDNHDERLKKLEQHGESDTSVAVQIGVLTERLTTVVGNLAKLDRDMQGVQRTLANMMRRKSTPITEFDQES